MIFTFCGHVFLGHLHAGGNMASLKVDDVDDASSGGVLTQAGADAAITNNNTAITQVSAERSKMGALLTRYPVIDGPCVARPVYFNGITRLSFYSHCGFGSPSPLAVVIAKLCVLIRRCIFRIARFKVFGR